MSVPITQSRRYPADSCSATVFDGPVRLTIRSQNAARQATACAARRELSTQLSLVPSLSTGPRTKGSITSAAMSTTSASEWCTATCSSGLSSMA